MQHIGVQREDEFGEVIADFDPRGIDLRIVPRHPVPAAACDSLTLTAIFW